MTNKSVILNKIKALFSAESTETFNADFKTVDGRIIRIYGETVATGNAVKEITADGEVDLEDGSFELEDGSTLVIADGILTEMIVAPEVPELEDVIEEEMEEVTETFVDTTLDDGTKVRVNGDVVIGNKVEVETAEGWVTAKEGQHNLADGRVIFVDAEGLINDIQTPDTKRNDEMMEEVFNSVKETLELVKSLKSEVEVLKTENSELKAKFSKFAKEPSVESISTKINHKEMSIEERLKFFGKR